MSQDAHSDHRKRRRIYVSFHHFSLFYSVYDAVLVDLGGSFFDLCKLLHIYKDDVSTQVSF